MSRLVLPSPSPCPCTTALPTAGDLGAIAKDYDIAVSTSCPALDYIVVDTTSAAQRCVELLRQVGGGRAGLRLKLQRTRTIGCALTQQPPSWAQTPT